MDPGNIPSLFPAPPNPRESFLGSLSETSGWLCLAFGPCSRFSAGFSSKQELLGNIHKLWEYLQTLGIFTKLGNIYKVWKSLSMFSSPAWEAAPAWEENPKFLSQIRPGAGAGCRSRNSLGLPLFLPGCGNNSHPQIPHLPAASDLRSFSWIRRATNIPEKPLTAPCPTSLSPLHVQGISRD